MTYAKKTLSEIKLIHGDFGNFIKGQKLDKRKEKKYKTPPYKDLAASNEIDGESLDEKCWPGYEKKGMKTMFGKRYPNCVKKKKTRKEEFSDWRSDINIDERKMTEKEKRKDDRLKKKYDKSDDMKKNFIKQYGKKKGLEVYYAYIRKEAMTEGVGSFAKGAIKFLAKKAKKYPVAAAIGLGAGTGANLLMMKKEVEKNLPKKDKSKELFYKEGNIQEILDKKDVPHVKKLIKKLKDSANAHEVQSKELEVALNTEDTAIESELVIQDWNSDDIKFTEIETVDIIKAKPLKENHSDWKNDLVELDEKFQFLKHAFGKSVIRATGADKAMGKFPRLSSKAVNTFIKNRSQIAVNNFKDKINKLKFDRFVQSADDLPTKFPSDNKVINIKKELNPNAIFPNKSNVKIKNEIISPDGISNKNPIKKKFNKDIKDHYDWRADLGEDWQKVNRKDKTDGMSQKAVDAYKRENPGSNLKTAVTGKVKKGSKASKRRRSFCARSDGQRKMHNIDCKKTPNKRICKARRRWKC